MHSARLVQTPIMLHYVECPGQSGDVDCQPSSIGNHVTPERRSGWRRSTYRHRPGVWHAYYFDVVGQS